ncbi:hypothetical protein ON010_g726 [Phytophthora cinnamomi]|nr:hypothetical protein ON010_g726 [Phytophthora cinnamomi]
MGAIMTPVILQGKSLTYPFPDRQHVCLGVAKAYARTFARWTKWISRRGKSWRADLLLTDRLRHISEFVIAWHHRLPRCHALGPQQPVGSFPILSATAHPTKPSAFSSNLCQARHHAAHRVSLQSARSPRGADLRQVDRRRAQRAVPLRQLRAAPDGLHVPSLPVTLVLGQVPVALRHPEDADGRGVRAEQRAAAGPQGLAGDPAEGPQAWRGAGALGVLGRVPHGPARVAGRLAAGQQAAAGRWPRRRRLRRCHRRPQLHAPEDRRPGGREVAGELVPGLRGLPQGVRVDLCGRRPARLHRRWLVPAVALKEIGGVCGDSVVIPGAGGGLGHLACQYARAMGYRVIAIDSGEDKRKLVASYGITDFIDFKEGNVRDKVLAATEGRGAHATVVVASGGEAYKDALSFLRPHGAVVLVGLPKDTYITAEVFGSVLNAHRIIGSYVGNRQDSIEALKLAAAGDVSTTYKIEKLENLPDVFERMAAGKLAGRIVLDCE